VDIRLRRLYGREVIGVLRPIVCVAAVSLVLTAAGCGSSSTTKAGAGGARSITITMQTPDGDSADAAYFANQVKARTDGRVVIAIDGNSYSSNDPDNELRLARDLRRGKARLAYIPSRAWERDGITNFRALQAPFLVTSYPLLHDITSGAIGTAMLRGLDGSGLVGVGLVPQELRRPLGRRPLTSAAAFDGAHVRVITSPTSIMDLRALSAMPVTTLDARQAVAALDEHRLDGVESDVHSIYGNGYVTVARYLTSNLPLFAKTETIVMGKQPWSELSPADRDALRAAARATVAHADPARRERSELAGLCSAGVRLVRAPPAAAVELQRESAGVYAALERDPATKHAIAAIRALRRSGPATVSALEQCTAPAPQPAAPGGRFPEGRFVTRVTKADTKAGGATWDPKNPVPFRITIRNGRWKTNERPPYSGALLINGPLVTLIIQHPSYAKANDTLRWSYYRGQLTFKVVSVADAASRVLYTAHPWRKVGR
jgi:TRAP-type C4-dicarboxylate transport system substrate-binding protein